jgi:hypothetical protein
MLQSTVHLLSVKKINLSHHLSYRLDLVKALVLKNKPQIPASDVERSSINPLPKQLLERHFTEKIPPTGHKPNCQKGCVVCC